MSEPSSEDKNPSAPTQPGAQTQRGAAPGTAHLTAHQLLAKYGLRAKKSFGQNFLISERAFRAIVDATVLDPTDWVIEIGAGLGTLTARLAERLYDGKLIALERDPDMIEVLRAELGNLENVHIEPIDALEYSFVDAARWAGESLTICGNLPYHVAAPLIFKALDARAVVRRIVVMVQREMADRIVAAPGSAAYGAMTVMIGAYADASMVIKVPAGAFVPPPKVESAVVQLVPLAQPRHEVSEPHFHRVVHAAFAQRRKTLRNSLQSAFAASEVAHALQATGLDGGRRAETLTQAEFAALAGALPAQNG